MRTRNLAIMFTDIKGYTERTGMQSHQETGALLKRHADLVVPVFRGFEGNVIKTIGDAFMVSFHSPTAAVQCGMAVLDQLHRHNHGRPTEEQIHLRVAINVGEVLISRGDVFGEPVNIASRVEGITPAGEVYLTEAVALTMNRSEVQTEPVGSFELKGIREPVRIHRVPPFMKARAAGELSGPNPAIGGDPAPVSVLVLPFGGSQLARLESQFLTPARRQQLTAVGVLAALGMAALITIPPYLRQREWERVEVLVGRGETAAARAALARMNANGETERRRFLSMQNALATRLHERGEAGAAAALLSQTHPRTPEEVALHLRLRQDIFQGLLRKQDVQGALALLHASESPTPDGGVEAVPAAMDPRGVHQDRVDLARLLLEKGRLEELEQQVSRLLAEDDKDARALALNGHLHFALSARSDKARHLLEGLKAYKAALEIELAAGDDPRVLANVAAAYNHGLAEGRTGREIRNLADGIVERYLGRRAVDELVKQLNAQNNTREAREKLATRVENLGARQEVDRVGLMLQDLKGISCRNRSGTGRALPLIERIRDESGRDPRAIGALLELAQKHDDCETAALDALHRMVGERVTFASADDLALSELTDELEKLNCRDRRAEEIRAELVRLADIRAVGTVLKLGAGHSACLEPAQKAAEGLLGRRVVYESAADTRLVELLDQLNQVSCVSRRGAEQTEETARALARHGDRRAVGPLLTLARRGGRCGDAALAASRQLLKTEALTLSCVHPALAEIMGLRCRSRKDARSAQKLVDTLVTDGQIGAAGRLLALAARRNACTDVLLDGARKLVKLDDLTLSCPSANPRDGGN